MPLKPIQHNLFGKTDEKTLYMDGSAFSDAVCADARGGSGASAGGKPGAGEFAAGDGWISSCVVGGRGAAWRRGFAGGAAADMDADRAREGTGGGLAEVGRKFTDGVSAGIPFKTQDGPFKSNNLSRMPFATVYMKTSEPN